MKTIKYEFVDRTSCEVEVSEEFYLLYLLLEKADEQSDRRETRRTCSLETLMDLGAQFGSERDNPLHSLIRQEDSAEFEKRLEVLTDEQRELWERVYIDGTTIADIAKENNLAYTTVHTKISRILKKLKKLL